MVSRKQKVNESGMEDSSPLPPPIHSLQEKQSRSPRSEAPVDSMLKDMATIIFSTFLLAGWVAFIITYPKVITKAVKYGQFPVRMFLNVPQVIVCD